MLNSIIELNHNEINHISGGTGEATVDEGGGDAPSFDIKFPAVSAPTTTVLGKIWDTTKAIVGYGYEGCKALSTGLVMYTFGKQLYFKYYHTKRS